MPIFEMNALATLKEAAAKWIGSKIVSRLKVLTAESRAYRTGNRGDDSGISQSFSETYERLLGGSPGTSELSGALAATERRISVPDWLRAPSIREWLALADSRDNLFAIARAAILHAPVDPDLRSGLTDSYAIVTGEAAARADGIINSVVDALVAGYTARLEDQTMLVVDAVVEEGQATRVQLAGGFSRVEAQLSALQGPAASSIEPLATNEASKLCDVILKTRSFDVAAPEKMRALAERVRLGDLADASQTTKEQIYIWAARLLTGNDTWISDAERYLALVSANPERNEVRVVQALLSEKKGNLDHALQILRDIDTPDGHAALLWVLRKADRKEAAIAWHESQVPPPSYHALTAMGWMTLANVYTDVGRWEDAIRCLETARPLASEFPDLYFMEGMHRAAMVVPLEFRPIVLNANLIYGNVTANEGAVAESWRASAIELLQRAKTALAPLNELRAEYASWCRLWLALGSKDEATRTTAYREIQDGVAGMAGATKLYPIARQFEVAVDVKALVAHLEVRRSIVGLSDGEWITQFFLALDTMGSPAEMLKFLDEYEDRLKVVVDPKALAHLRIQALLKSEGQATRALKVLDSNRTIFSEIEFSRIQVEIAGSQGADIRPQLEELYERAPTLLNLTALVEYLARVNDISALEPLARQLYELERTVAHARTVAVCLRHDPIGGASSLVKFLEAEADVVGENNELQSELAWAHFACGNWKAAKNINDQLIEREPTIERHVGLDINLAVQSGDWNRFAVIFEREWPLRDGLSPGTLLLLANLAAEGHAQADKAFELIKLAADKANEDSQILVAAYFAALRIGKETEITAKWLESAVATDSSGTAKVISLREVVENVIPSTRTRAESALDALAKGTAPIHIIAKLLNVPLARMYVSIPSANEAEADARQRVVLPFFAARIDEPPIDRDWSIGLDLTAILTLATLELLPTVFSAFKTVVIAQDTMARLLNEKQRVRFQQPSEVRLAESLLDSMERIPIQLANSDGIVPPGWLIEEVGAELAQLLECARTSNGFVVASFPILRISSLGEEVANLRDYASLVLTVRTFVEALSAGGKAVRVDAMRADGMLAGFDRGELGPVPDDVLNRTLYIDQVALRHLQQAGVFATASLSLVDLRTLPSSKAEYLRIINDSKARGRTEATIDSARKHLRAGLEQANVCLLGERKSRDEQDVIDTSGLTDALTIRPFLQSTREIDALIVDDRFLTRSASIADVDGRTVPMLSSLDLLAAFEKHGVCDKSNIAYLRHRLRAMGAALVSIRDGELWSLLEACTIDRNGVLQESAELRMLRQMTIQSCTLTVSDPGDRMFFDAISRAVDSVLAKLWASDSEALARAIATTNWIVDGLMRVVWTAAASTPEPNRDFAKSLFGLTVGGWLVRAAFWGDSLRNDFHNIVTTSILEPAARANRDFVDSVASHVGALLRSYRDSRDASAEVDAWIELLLSRMPTPVHDRICDDEVLGDFARARRVSVVHFSTAHSVTLPELYVAAQTAVQDGAYIHEEQPRYRLTADREAVAFEVEIDNQWKSVEMPELGGLLPSAVDRRANLERALKETGPTYAETESILSSIIERPLSAAELDALLNQRAHGLRARWDRIYAARREPLVREVVAPGSIDYYSELLGPLAGSADVSSYMAETLMPYRRALVERDLAQGLRLVLFGFLHPTLAPSQLVEALSNNEVWDAIEGLQSARDPFTLVGMAEIAIRRLDDDRFRQLAEDCIVRICDSSDNGRQIFAETALFAEAALGVLQQVEAAAELRPYWKRMSAWMQGGVVLHQYRDFRFNVELLSAWVDDQTSVESQFADIVDLYEEPLASCGWMTAEACRDNSLRLLKWAVGMARESGVDVPKAEVLDATIRARMDEYPASLLFPGPGGSINDIVQLEPTDEQRRDLEADFKMDGLSRAWFTLCVTSQLVQVPRTVYVQGVESLKTLSLEKTDSEWIGKMGRASEAGVIAIANEDCELADALRDFLIRSAPQADDSERVSALINALVLAAGAYRDRDTRDEWLHEASKRVSVAIPAGPASAAATWLFSSLANVSIWRAGPATWAELHTRAAS